MRGTVINWLSRNAVLSGLLAMGIFIGQPSAAAEQYVLAGTWHVDVTKTMKLSAENYRKPPLFLKLFGCSLNSTALTFTANTMELSVAAHECENEGKRRTIEAAVSKATYTTIFEDEEQMAVVFTAEDGRHVDVNVLNWTTADRFWVDMAFDSDVTRYFFERE